MTNSASGGAGRNALCSCGSGEKYKRCCGSAAGAPAGRGAFQRGVQLLQAGLPTMAVPALLEAIQADATHVDAHLALGAALMQGGRFADAAGIFSRATQLQPNAAAAHRDLGAAYECQNLHEPAIQAYRRAAELAPKLADVQQRLGTLYALYSRKAEAADCFDRAAGASPKTTQARLYRSDAALLRGDIAAAEQWARKAVALEPGSSAAQGTLGGLLYLQGRFAEASVHFETSLRLDPAMAKSWDGLAHCRTYTEADSGIFDRLRQMLRRSDVPAPARMTMQFALGKMLQDSGDYAGAMQHFDAGNALRGQGPDFDRAGFAAAIDRAVAMFPPDVTARRQAAASQNETPLFIVGMYRSGTTLVEQILSSHPDIVAGGELTVWADTDITSDRANAAVTRYLSVLQEIGPAAARVTDKLPFNFLRLGAIHALLPRARIIHCRRDPIDTCLSIYTTLFDTGVPFAASRDDLVFCYRHYLRLMDHWRRVLPPDIFIEVDYEELIADRDAQTRRLVAFAGLDWNDACLRPDQNPRPIGTASAWQARQPVYGSSVQRWRRYEPWLGALRGLLPEAG